MTYDQWCQHGYYSVINIPRNTLMPHYKPVSSKQLGDIVIQDSRKYFMEEMGGM